MPKVLLIHATDPDLQLAEQPRMPFPVLGVTTIAGLFPEEWEVSVIDEDFEPVDTSQKADLVGISTLTLNAPHAYKLADTFRQRGVAVLMGGNASLGASRGSAGTPQRCRGWRGRRHLPQSAR